MAPVMAGTITKAVLSMLLGVNMSVCLPANSFCECDCVKVMQNAVTKPSRFIVEIIMKAEFEDGCGSSKALEAWDRNFIPLAHIRLKSWIAVSW